MRAYMMHQRVGPGVRLVAALAVALVLFGIASWYTPSASAASRTPRHPTSGAWGESSVVTVTSANSSGDIVSINNPKANGNPNALVFVTPTLTINGQNNDVYDNHPIGVWYDPFGFWTIFNEDGAAMPLGASFNVFAVLNSSYCDCFTQVATAANTTSNSTSLGASNPNDVILVTPNWTPNDVYDTHPLGVAYSSQTGSWAIFNQDGATMTTGAVFNVLDWGSPFSSVFVQTATSANSQANYTLINNASTNGNPNLFVFATPNWNPGNVGGVSNNHNIGVWYVERPLDSLQPGQCVSLSWCLIQHLRNEFLKTREKKEQQSLPLPLFLFTSPALVYRSGAARWCMPSE